MIHRYTSSTLSSTLPVCSVDRHRAPGVIDEELTPAPSAASYSTFASIILPEPITRIPSRISNCCPLARFGKWSTAQSDVLPVAVSPGFGPSEPDASSSTSSKPKSVSQPCRRSKLRYPELKGVALPPDSDGTNVRSARMTFRFVAAPRN